MLGIALGSFTQGFAQGANLRLQMDEIGRQRDLRKSVEGITKSGKAQYDADVAAGKAEPGDFMSTYANELVPQIAEKYLEAGEPDKASAWTDWASSTAAKTATKSFNKGLGQFQAGDVEGGIKSMLKAGNQNGYGPDGKMSAAEIYDEEAGQVTGYRLTYKLSDGKEHTKNVAVNDLPNFFAATINPESAFELQQADAAARAKADLEVETYGRKKAKEKELGVATGQMTQAQYQNAIQEERKAIENNALIDPDIKDMTADEKEQLAKDTVDKRLGMAPTADAGPQVTVNPETGEQVQMPVTPAQDAAQPAPAQPDALQADPSMGIDPDAMSPPEEQPVSQAPGISQPTPAAANSQVDPTQKQALVDQAAQLMKQGGSGQQIAEKLIAAGVPPQQWPQSVQLAARSASMGISR